MTEELIRKFFNKECTPEEAKLVADYLKNNPSVLEKYASKEEWDEIKDEIMPAEHWNEAWENITAKRRPVIYMRWIKRAAAAAVLVFIAGVGYNYFFSKPAPAVATSKDVVVQHLTNTRNTLKEIMRVTLPDSSVVLLGPASVITYNVPFDDDKRNIQLEGEGRFIVKKDAAKPFTVFAGNLATTALGTEFTINTNASNSKVISVKLHSGKVVIKQTGEIAKAWKKDIYLDPGEQLEYNTGSLAVAVTKIKDEKNAIAAIKPTIKKKNTATINSDELVFTSSSLTEVIEKIEKLFNANIEFDSADINTMNFTGTISKNDSLPIVLKVIAQMNGLELIQENDGFRLRKQ